jgi:hypothetical protein
MSGQPGAVVYAKDSPVRRTDTPIKLVFTVAGIEAVRVLAAARGGQLDPPERRTVGATMA